ncbi:MAG: hypothetical protein OEY78_12145 [Gammaproteobacteria bacterium]|nr:hypothetical protein [Gammaproteobacteria bacterium]
MSRIKFVLCFCFFTAGFSGNAFAGQFDWLKDLEVSAKADPRGYALKLASRFKIGDAEVKTVLSNVKNHSDAYMVLKLGELSGNNTNTVIDQYNSSKDRGWGVMAKQLGIKPGSPEFHALKQGHDLNSRASGKEEKMNKKNKNKGQGKGNNKGQGKGNNKGNKNK